MSELRYEHRRGHPFDWLHKPRGGYGYTLRVPCRVVRMGRKRVLIAALRTDGTELERWVERSSLRER